MRWSSGAYPGRRASSSRPTAARSGPPGRPDLRAARGVRRRSGRRIDVLADARRQGIGTALLTAVSDRARIAGKTALHMPASEARPDGIDFLLHRGFREYERTKTVRLELAGRARPAIDLPGRSPADHARRASRTLVEGVHAVAIEAFADIPGGDQPMAAGDLAEFRARDVDRPTIPHDGVHDRPRDGDRSRRRLRQPAAAAPHLRRIAWHDMTAVARDWRGRGLAGALKRATIALGDRRRPRPPRGGQRHGQPADARGQRPARLPAGAGLPRPARSAVRAASWPGDDDIDATAPCRRHRPPLPADPAEYDSPRAQIARAKGLEAPYIAGGLDPDPRPGLEEERHYGKLLLAMVVALMFGGFIIGVGADDRHRQHASMTPVAAPSSAIDGPAWTIAVDADSSTTLRDLIRIPSVNPPPPDAPDGELVARPPHRGDADRGRPRARDRRAGPGSRLRPRPAARRRDGRRAAPPAVASRRRARAARALDATTRSRPTSPTATSTAAARST